MPHQTALRAYLEARDRGDAAAARSYLAPDARIWVGAAKEGPGRPMGVNRDFAAWETTVNARFHYSAFRSETKDTVSYRSEESSDFAKLLGVDAVRGDVTCWFDGLGRITGLLYRPVGPRTSEIVQPYVDWARLHKPERLAALMPDGQMVYNAQTAQLWLEALREWRKATAKRS
jgi:hypothetical protein